MMMTATTERSVLYSEAQMAAKNQAELHRVRFKNRILISNRDWKPGANLNRY